MSKKISLRELEILVVDFAERRQYGYKKSTVKNFFVKKNNDGEYVENSFMSVLLTVCAGTNNQVGRDEYALAVRQAVKSYGNSKDTAVDLVKRLTADVEKRTGCRFEIEYPPIPIGNTFERLMYISKYLQNPEAKISDLEDILWLSDRTIDGDILKLRGMDDDPIQICGKKYVIDYVKRENDHVRDMASTPHPLFLTCNITQVIVTLKGLRTMSEDVAFAGYAMKTASEIWEQLSDLAKDRILYVTQNMLPEEEEWFRRLGNMGDNTFWPEYSCSSYGSNALIECMKNSIPCYIEYFTEEGSEFFDGVQVKAYYGDTVVVCQNGAERELKVMNILRSAKQAELLV